MAEPAPITLEKAWARLMHTLGKRNLPLVKRNRIVLNVLHSEQRHGR